MGQKDLLRAIYLCCVMVTVVGNGHGNPSSKPYLGTYRLLQVVFSLLHPLKHSLTSSLLLLFLLTH